MLRVRSDAHAHITAPSDWCSLNLGPVLPSLVKALAAPDLSLRERLLKGAAGAPRVLEAFMRDGGQDWPLALPPGIVFPDSPWPVSIHLARDDARRAFRVDDTSQLQVLQAALSGRWADCPPGSLEHQLGSHLLKTGLLTDDEPTRVDFSEPGFYRLQHASVMVVSDKGKILIDPVTDIGDDDWCSPRCLPKIDAIFISHGHYDHYSLPTLLQFPRETKIVLPVVERASMLCPDLAGYLRAAGFTDVVEAAWGTRITAADIDVDIHPFWGEQPWAAQPPSFPALRNHGNTFLVHALGQRAWFLVDSGFEHGHSMLDVARDIRRDHGRIDMVLSNLREFRWHPGQIDGSGRYLFCFDRATLSQPATWPRGATITLASSGVAGILALLGARFFLPYAHWFHTPLEPIRVDNRLLEDEMVGLLAEHCQAVGAGDTTHVGWRIGQAFVRSDRSEEWRVEDIAPAL